LSDLCRFFLQRLNNPPVETFPFPIGGACYPAMEFGIETKQKVPGKRFFGLLAMFFAHFEVIIDGILQSLADFINRFSLKGDDITNADENPSERQNTSRRPWKRL